MRHHDVTVVSKALECVVVLLDSVNCSLRRCGNHGRSSSFSPSSLTTVCAILLPHLQFGNTNIAHVRGRRSTVEIREVLLSDDSV